MKEVFIRTENVSNFNTAVLRLQDYENGTPGLGLVWGKAGRGKTKAAEAFYAQNGGVYLRVWQDWTQNALLQQLCFEICGERPARSMTAKNRIVAALQEFQQTIFVDEADRLKLDRFEDLRDIHEATGCSVVLIGEEELFTLAQRRTRIWSRVTQKIHFSPVSPHDISLFAADAAGLDVGQKEAALISQNTGGDFRFIRNMLQSLEQVARARKASVVTAEMVQDVVKKGRIKK